MADLAWVGVQRVTRDRSVPHPGPVGGGRYWTAFRYGFYQTASDVDDDLQAWLRFHNYQRPHRGYRTRGRPPAAIHYANRPDLLEQKGWNPNDILNSPKPSGGNVGWTG